VFVGGRIITTEQILFEKEGVKITDRQVIFGDDSVLLQDITMVHTSSGPGRNRREALLY